MIHSNEYQVDFDPDGRSWVATLRTIPSERVYGFKSEQEADQFAKVKWPHSKRFYPSVPRKTVFSVRSHVYRDQQGFLIAPAGVFARTRRGAEEIRDAYKAGDRTQISATITRVFAEERAYNIFSHGGLFKSSHASLTSAEHAARIEAKKWGQNMTVVKAVPGDRSESSAGTIVSVWGPDGKGRRVKTPSRANPAWAKVFG